MISLSIRRKIKDEAKKGRFNSKEEKSNFYRKFLSREDKKINDIEIKICNQVYN